MSIHELPAYGGAYTRSFDTNGEGAGHPSFRAGVVPPPGLSRFPCAMGDIDIPVAEIRRPVNARADFRQILYDYGEEYRTMKIPVARRRGSP